MAVHGDGWDESFEANADLSTKWGYAVELLSTGKVDACNAATDRPLGILQNKPAAAGRAASVRVFGSSKAVSDGTVNGGIAIGDLVGPGATGKMVKKSTNDNTVLGTARGASTADGTVIEVLIGVGVHSFRTPA